MLESIFQVIGESLRPKTVEDKNERASLFLILMGIIILCTTAFNKKQ